MIGLITHINETISVHMEAIAESECVVAQRVSGRARGSGDSDATRTIPGPLLHSIVGCVEHIDECVGHEDVRGLIELRHASSLTRAKNGGGVVRTGFDDDHSMIIFISNVQSRPINNPYAVIRIQGRRS